MAAGPASESMTTSTRSSKRQNTMRWLDVGRDSKASMQARIVASWNSRQTSSGMPANSARQRTAPPAAAAKRGSASTYSSIRFGSVATSVREGDVASFTAVRAVVEPIHAKANILHVLADGAVLVASALVFGLVALNAKHRAGGHRSLLEQTLPERVALRQVQQRGEIADQRASLTGLGARASIDFLLGKTEWNPSQVQ